MSALDHVVVDTNVAATANGNNADASADCVLASARALQQVMSRGQVYLDDGGAIVAEYRRNLSATGQPGPGDVFLKWLLTHEWNECRVTRVHITPRADDPADYEELPAPPEGVVYDPSDRKFLTVSIAHENRPPILQSMDSKWWGWQSALQAHGVRIRFLCPGEIEAKYHQKIT